MIFAGATVVIALCGLVVARIPFLAVMGYAAAAAVAVAVAVALTVVPAMLALAGERLRPKPGSRAARTASVQPDETHTLGAKWVALVTKVPALTVVVTVGVLLVLALPAGTSPSACPTTAPPSGHHPAEDVRPDQPRLRPRLQHAAARHRRHHPHHRPHRRDGRPRQGHRQLDGVDAVALATPNRTADLGIVQVIPEKSQTDPATAALVEQIRADRPALEEKYDITELRVTGQTAVTIDVSDRLGRALLPFGDRGDGAVPAPADDGVPLDRGADQGDAGLPALGGASFGAVAAVFQWGWCADAAQRRQGRGRSSRSCRSS